MFWLQLKINIDAFPRVWIENYDPIVTGRVLTQSIKQTIFCLSLYDVNNGDNSTLTNTGHCAFSLHSPLCHSVTHLCSGVIIDTTIANTDLGVIMNIYEATWAFVLFGEQELKCKMWVTSVVTTFTSRNPMYVCNAGRQNSEFLCDSYSYSIPAMSW